MRTILQNRHLSLEKPVSAIETMSTQCDAILTPVVIPGMAGSAEIDDISGKMHIGTAAVANPVKAQAVVVMHIGEVKCRLS